MTPFLITLGSILGYGFGAGASGNLFAIRSRRKCRHCGTRELCEDHMMASMFIGAFWPVTLPGMAGSATIHAISDSEGRRERKAKRNELKHQRKLELMEAERKDKELDIKKLELESKSAIEYLEANGVKASVPGMFDQS